MTYQIDSIDELKTDDHKYDVAVVLRLSSVTGNEELSVRLTNRELANIKSLLDVAAEAVE